ncbi:MAG: group I intron-associated PD-(D/E)XK endonuclease [Terriglobales bacterium]
MRKTALHPKAKGEAAEVYFFYKATCQGLRLSKPLGDSAPYDVISEYQGRLARIQVKSTTVCAENNYSIQVSFTSQRRPYTAREIDFVAAYVGPEDVWYIIPVKVLRCRTNIHLYPHTTGVGQFEQFREAWRLLLGPLPRGTRSVAGKSLDASLKHIRKSGNTDF